ncbi:MAG TPA: DUF1778 domain-containing protein [Rhizomicrobium sp.]|nr:DUF1778 domain-containing protein [Rhizomicrobium sp.]
MTKRPAQRKNQPLSMRLPKADIAIIDRAAAMRGRSRTDFVRDAAVLAAEDVVMTNTMIRMSPAGFQAFVDAISAPGKPVKALIEVFKRKAPWET